MIILLGFSFLLPASTLILQKRYKHAAFCFFCLLIIFSIPAWLRLWSNPAGFLLSVALMALGLPIVPRANSVNDARADPLTIRGCF